MAFLGILAMIGHLCVEPLVNSGDQSRVRRAVRQLGSALDVLVFDGQTTRLCPLDLSQPGHLRAMNMTGPGKISLKELGPDRA